MVMAVWEPKIIRETTSRPKSSVPNQCTADAGEHGEKIGFFRVVGRDPPGENRHQDKQHDDHRTNGSQGFGATEFPDRRQIP